MIDQSLVDLERRVLLNPNDTALRAQYFGQLRRLGQVSERAIQLAANHRDSAALMLLSEQVTEERIETDQDLALLQKLPIQTLDLSGCEEISNDGLTAIAHLPIEQLKLCSPESAVCKVTGAGLKHLQRMPLKDLRIENCDDLSTGLPYLASRPLKILDVSYFGIAGSFVTDEGLSQLKDLPLERLNLDWCCELSAEGLKDLAGLPLRELSAIGQGDALTEALPSFRGMPLERLNSRVRLEDRELCSLSQSPMRDLEFAWGPQITERGLDALGNLPLEKARIICCEDMNQLSLRALAGPQLKRLQLVGCGPSLGSALKELTVSPVEELSLDCPITDNDLWALRRLPLKILHLKDCSQLSDDGLRALEQMPLEELHLMECGKLTGLGLRYLSRAPIHTLSLSAAQSLRDSSLEFLAELPIESLSLVDCGQVSRAGLRSLRGLPLKNYSIWGIANADYRALDSLDLPGRSYSGKNHSWDSQFAEEIPFTH